MFTKEYKETNIRHIKSISPIDLSQGIGKEMQGKAKGATRPSPTPDFVKALAHRGTFLLRVPKIQKIHELLILFGRNKIRRTH